MSRHVANERFATVVQTDLKKAGFYKGAIDGWAGPDTVDAYRRSRQDISVPSPSPAPEEKPTEPVSTLTFDERSERNLKTLQYHVERTARTWLSLVRKSNIHAVVICGTRTFAEQDELYASGRTKPGKIITKARAGFSMHNFGLAWDAVAFEGTDARGGLGKPLWEGQHLKVMAKIAADLGIEWGGLWKFYDSPHYQISGGKTIANLRKEMPRGWVT